MQKRSALSILALSLLAILAACSKGSNGQSVVFVPQAMHSLPSVKSTTGSVMGSPGSRAAAPVADTSNISGYLSLVQLFRFECQHVPDTNYCPPGTVITDSLMDPTRFEMGSLIGILFHAQLYAGQLVSSCSGDGYSPVTISVNSFSAANSAAAADPARFIVPTFSTYTCRDFHLDQTSNEARVVSAASDGSYQASLTTRYQYAAGGEIQTDLFQVDVSLTNGQPQRIALNFAAATPHAERALLLVDLVSHRFVLKYYVPAQNGGGAYYAVALGVGGYDQSGTPNAGYYNVTFTDDNGSLICVDNATGDIQPDNTSCAAASVPTSWTDSNTVATYLGFTGGDLARVQPFLDKFDDEAALGAPDAWAAPGDEDLYWPATIH